MVMFLLAVTTMYFLLIVPPLMALPSKEDCTALWNAVGGAGGDLKSVATKGGVAMDGVLKLYEDCLRSEEGIRYRRGGFPNVINDHPSDRRLHLMELLSKMIKQKCEDNY